MVPTDVLTSLTAPAVVAQAADGVNHTYWYLSRAAGLCAYVVLVANLALGLALSASLLERFVLKWRIFDLHQFTGLLFVALLLLHVFVLLGDAYLGFTVPQLLVPFLSPYRTWAVTVGVLAFYGTLVVTFTFYIRRYIGQQTWRMIHYGSFAVFVFGLLHSFLAGTDAATIWALLLYGVTAAGLAGLTAWRFTAGRAPAPLSAARASRSRPPIGRA